MADGATKKCPMGHTELCLQSGCEWYDEANKACAVLSVARILAAGAKVKAPAPKSKGGK